jgi:hypothetical protein
LSSSTEDDSIPRPGQGALLARHLCRVMGVNRNFKSRSGTPYHVQVEDRGPVFDDATEAWVRRINVIVYANYGEPTARIVHGRDHDLPDLRTHQHNQAVARRIQELAADAGRILEQREERQVARFKLLLRSYYDTRREAVKREVEEANALYPFVFARAFQDLKGERLRADADAGSAAGAGGEQPAAAADETLYPLDPAERDLVLDVERLAQEMERDLLSLKARGASDDILRATCAKLLARGRESLSHRDGGEFALRRMEMMRKSLVAAYQQVRARLSRAGGE